jgi:hypothetical protein
MSTSFTTTNLNPDSNLDPNPDPNPDPNLKLTAHILAVRQATKTIQNAYRFIQEMAPSEDVFNLCATIQDHIERVTAAENVPPQMRGYEMILESAREFALIPEDASPSDIVNILKTTLEPTKLTRSHAVLILPETESQENINTLIFDQRLEREVQSIMFPSQDYYHVGPTKLFSDDEGEDDDEF